MTEEKKDTQKQQPIWVDEKYCKACKDCIWACPMQLLRMKKTKAGEVVFVEHRELCDQCMACVYVCPEPMCIHVQEKKEFVFPKKTGGKK